MTDGERILSPISENSGTIGEAVFDDPADRTGAISGEAVLNGPRPSSTPETNANKRRGIDYVPDSSSDMICDAELTEKLELERNVARADFNQAEESRVVNASLYERELKTVRHLRVELEAVKKERDALRTAQQKSLDGFAALTAERDTALAKLEDELRDRAEMEPHYKAIEAQRDEALAERDNLWQHRDAMQVELEKLTAERDAALVDSSHTLTTLHAAQQTIKLLHPALEKCLSALRLRRNIGSPTYDALAMEAEKQGDTAFTSILLPK